MDGEAEPTMRLHLHVSHAVQGELFPLRGRAAHHTGLSWYGRVKSGGYHVPPA